MTDKEKTEVHIRWNNETMKWECAIMIGGDKEMVLNDQFDTTDAALDAVTALLSPRYDPDPVELYGNASFTVALDWVEEIDAWQARVLAYHNSHMVLTKTSSTNMEALWHAKRILESKGITIKNIEIWGPKMEESND